MLDWFVVGAVVLLALAMAFVMAKLHGRLTAEARSRGLEPAPLWGLALMSSPLAIFLLRKRR